MKRFIILWPMLVMSICGYAQNTTIQAARSDCNFLSSLRFKNGKAVVIIDATYYDIHEAAPIYAEHGFRKHKTLLGERIYSGTDITFTPKGCSKQLSEPLTYLHNCCSAFKPGSPICLTLTVFQNYSGYDTRLFLVVKDISNPKYKVD